MRNNKEIRIAIIELWKYESEHTDICLCINMHTDEARRINYRCMPSATPWKFFRNFDNHDMLIETDFNNLFDDYMGEEDQTNISIEEIKIIPKIQL